MAYTGLSRPTLTTIRNRITTAVNNNLPGQDAGLRNTVLNVLVDGLAGLSHELHGRIDWIEDQTNLLYCTGAQLDLYGQIYGTPRKVATRASGTITCTGSNGSVIPVNTIFQHADGTQIISTAAATISSGTATVSVNAVTVGVSSDKAAGQPFTLFNSVAGVATNAVVVSLTGGTDIETDDLYRGRLLNIIQAPAMGGNINDYAVWAKQIPGVTRVWVNPNGRGIGTVDVRFLMDNTYTNGIPLAGDVATVNAYLNDPTRKPVCADVLALAPATVAYNISISNLTPLTPLVQANIQAELTDLFLNKSFPGCTIYSSMIWSAIANATGTQHFTLVSPTTDTTYTVGQMPVLGVISYV